MSGVSEEERVFESGLDDAETRDDAFRVAQALIAYMPQTDSTAEVFGCFYRIVRKARLSQLQSR